MIKADLITGFLGSGKTTFIKQYATYLKNKGEKICILENDFGAINVDMMLLQDLRKKGIDLEMIAGGCDKDCHIRRFKTKLITISMLGYDRVIIEPSGLFDVDELFDIIHEDDVYGRVKIDNIICLVDVTSINLSSKSLFMFASQIAVSGKVILTHTDCVNDFELKNIIPFLNNALKSINCKRVLTENEIMVFDGHLFNDNELDKIKNSSFIDCSYTKQYNIDDIDYSSLFFMNSPMSVKELKVTAHKLFADNKCGDIQRIKGFVNENEIWFEINCNRESFSIKEIEEGQRVIIVIGENLNCEYIDSFIPSSNSSVSVVRNIQNK